MTPTEVHAFLRVIALWVNARSDLNGLALAGSWSRGNARRGSDLDLLILADNPEKYAADQHWLYPIPLPAPFRIVSYWGRAYGTVWSCHALLQPTAKLELTFAAVDWASSDPIDEETRQVISDGFEVLVDKGGCLQRIVEAVRNSQF